MPVDQKRKRAKTDTSLFRVAIPDLGNHMPYTTYVEIDEKERLVYYGNAQSRSLYVLNSGGLRMDSFSLAGPPMRK